MKDRDGFWVLLEKGERDRVTLVAACLLSGGAFIWGDFMRQMK